MVSGPRWRANVTRETTARMRRDAEATWQGRGWPTRGPGSAQSADTWQEATRVHVGPRGCPCGVPRGRGVGVWRAHGLVGNGKFIGAVMQMLTAPLHYIGASSIFFFRVGLCPHGNYLCRTRGASRGIGFDREEERFIDRVDPSPCDHQSRHVLKIRSK